MTCRWPEKQRHASREAAVAAIRKLYKAGRGNPDYVPYPCGNHWHLEHGPDEDAARPPAEVDLLRRAHRFVLRVEVGRAVPDVLDEFAWDGWHDAARWPEPFTFHDLEDE